VIGADAHERTHTFVAAVEMGREVASKKGVATAAGHTRAVVFFSFLIDEFSH
jgi:hypothetical protein